MVNAGDQAAFVAEFNAAGSALVYSTYLGSSYGDTGQAIAIDSSGAAHVSGTDLNHIMVAWLDGPFIYPVVSGGGNAASYGTYIAPGSIASIFGQGLGGLASQTVKVVFSQADCLNASAPLFYVSASQINFQVPWELCAPGTYVTYLGVSVNGLFSAPGSNGGMVPAPFAPGIFTMNASGSGLGAILIAGSAELAAPAGSVPGRASRPAKPGEHISIYCTGLGPVTNRPATAMRAVVSPLSDDHTADGDDWGRFGPGKLFRPGAVLIGLYQVNVQVPASSLAGDAVPVSLSIMGAASNTVTMAVAAP